MNDWIECVVGDVAAPTRNALVGGPFGSNLVSKDYVDYGVPVIRGQNMGFGKWVTGDFVFVSPEKARELAANIARPGDLVFTQRGTLGQVAIVPDAAYERYIVSQSQMKLTVDSEKADAHFLYYYFSTSEQQEHIRQNCIQTGGPHTNLTILRNTPLYLPPPPEQRAIARILGSLDDKIEANRRMNETLEATARAIFKSWFVDFDPVHYKSRGEQPPGMDAETAALFPDSFEEGEFGLIPRGWRIGTLGDVAENPRRSVHPHSLTPDILYIGLEHMPQHSISLSDWGLATDVESNKYQFFQGEFLFGKLRPYFHKVGIAPIDGICSTDILVVTSAEDDWWGFVLMIISDTTFVDYTTQVSGGTRMPRVNWRDMSNYRIVTPDRDTAGAFSRFTKETSRLMIENIHQSRTLAETRDALLPKLVSGELRVDEVEDVEV